LDQWNTNNIVKSRSYWSSEPVFGVYWHSACRPTVLNDVPRLSKCVIDRDTHLEYLSTTFFGQVHSSIFSKRPRVHSWHKIQTGSWRASVLCVKRGIFSKDYWFKSYMSLSWNIVEMLHTMF